MLPRRTIQELLTFHELHPDLSDVFTEGPSDRNLVRWFVDDLELTSVSVYDISVIDIPATQLADLQLENSNRGRVIALAMLCAGLRPLQVVCIVDADLDRLLGRTVPNSPLLMTTDYACAEMYAFNAVVLNKFIRFHKDALTKTSDTVIAELTPLLHALFALRAANVALGWNMQAVDWSNSTTLTDNGITFDVDDYIHRYLLRNGRLHDGPQFRAQFDALRARIAGDSRHYINGDDFWTALQWYLRNHAGGFHLRPLEVRDALLASLEHRALSEEPLFAQLRRRLSP